MDSRPSTRGPDAALQRSTRSRAAVTFIFGSGVRAALFERLREAPRFASGSGRVNVPCPTGRVSFSHPIRLRLAATRSTRCSVRVPLAARLPLRAVRYGSAPQLRRQTVSTPARAGPEPTTHCSGLGVSRCAPSFSPLNSISLGAIVRCRRVQLHRHSRWPAYAAEPLGCANGPARPGLPAATSSLEGAAWLAHLTEGFVAVLTLSPWRRPAKVGVYAGHPNASLTSNLTSPIPAGSREPGRSHPPVNLSAIYFSDRPKHLASTRRRRGGAHLHPLL